MSNPSAEQAQEDKQRQFALGHQIGLVCNGKHTMDIVAALGMMTINVILNFVGDPNEALEGLKAHHRDVEKTLERIAKAQRTEH